MDVRLLAERGIVYCNSAAACTESVADLALYLIISTFRLFSLSQLNARSCDRGKFLEAQHGLASMTTNPRGHTLGIVGLGRIGQRIAQKAHAAFPMKIAYHDLKRAPAAVEAELEATYHRRLETLFATADCVILATPYTGSRLLSTRELALMKPRSRLINIARGKLIDEDALVRALQSGHLSAAGLDVHENEPRVDERLAAMPNVALTCHNGGTSVDSLRGFEEISMRNLLGFLERGREGAETAVNLDFFS